MFCLVWPTWVMQFGNNLPEEAMPQDVKFITISYVFSYLFADTESYHGRIFTIETCLKIYFFFF